MSGPVAVEQAREADSARIFRVMEASPGAPQWTRAQVDHLFRTGPVRRTVLVTRCDGAVTGFAVVALLPHTEPVMAELESIAVLPEMQRRGIGRVLLNGAVDAALQQGAAILQLEVRESNVAALALYAACQFTTVGFRRRYYSHPLEDAVLVERRLASSP